MKLTGKQKAQLFLSLLGPSTQAVLSHLPKNYAAILTSSIQNVPTHDKEDTADIIQEVIHRLEALGASDSLGRPTIGYSPGVSNNDASDMVSDTVSDRVSDETSDLAADDVAYHPHENADLGLGDEQTEHDRGSGSDLDDDDDDFELGPDLQGDSDEGVVNSVQRPTADAGDESVLLEPLADSADSPTGESEQASTAQSVDFKAIAEQLSQEKPQIIAFYLSRQTPDVREYIELALPGEVMDQVKLAKVEKIPAAAVVYDSLQRKLMG